MDFKKEQTSFKYEKETIQNRIAKAPWYDDQLNIYS